MTRYKEYLRTKGYKLECDYDYLPIYETGLETITTEITNHGIAITYYHVSISYTKLIQRDGTEAYEIM